MTWKQGTAQTSSKVLGEAGPWVETGDLLSSSLHREGEGETGGGAPSEKTKSYKNEGKDKDKDKDINLNMHIPQAILQGPRITNSLIMKVCIQPSIMICVAKMRKIVRKKFLLLCRDTRHALNMS